MTQNTDYGVLDREVQIKKTRNMEARGAINQILDVGSFKKAYKV